jgi:hypothetical protein
VLRGLAMTGGDFWGNPPLQVSSGVLVLPGHTC